MRLLIISDAPILKSKGKKEAYAPYVREMDLWMKYVDHITFICPTYYNRSLLTQPFIKQDFTVKSLRRLEFHNYSSAFWSLCNIPYQFIVLCFAFANADHIHLRCPGNLALLASIAQILFPSKKKTAKYAGNFDPNAAQPVAYRWQKNILSNTFLTKNISILAYGKWPNQSKNVKPFFTATYRRNQITALSIRDWNGPFKSVFVGTMGANKRPLEVLEIIKSLTKDGIDISIDYYGDGPLKNEMAVKIDEYNLHDKVRLHGNVDNSIVTKAYKNAHFSFLLSKSEGWPKAVAEAMFWGCVPIASAVSCVPWMLGCSNNQPQREDARCGRGILINDLSTADAQVAAYLRAPELLQELSQNAAIWSRKYTLDDFEEAIQELLQID